MKKHTVRFTILLTEKDNEEIEALREETGLSKGQLIREGIRAKYAMHVQGIPTCATGQHCLVPHVHPQRKG